MYKLNIRKIRQRMEEQGMSISKLAEVSGLSASWVREVLNGGSENPRINTAMHLAVALGFELEDIVTKD